MDTNQKVNRVLCWLYVPLSALGFFFPMGLEALVDETNPVRIVWTYIYSHTVFFMFAFCLGSMLLSRALYQKNAVRASYIVRFIPIYIVIAVLLADAVIAILV